MSDAFRLAAGRIHDSHRYTELFLEPTERGIRKTYLEYLKQIHPDVAGAEHEREANELKIRLDELYESARRAAKAGTNGAPALFVIESSGVRHECMRQRTRFFDMTTGYDAVTIHGSTREPSIVKLANTPRDNELLEAEAAALATLAMTDDGHRAFYPELFDSVMVERGAQRLRANVVRACDGFVNLEQVRDHYPGGIHPLDMAWMWRRILWALGGAHAAGVLHGALVPRHIMIHPTLHGVVLVDWCYSVQRVDDTYPRIKAIVGQYRDWYPAKVLDRQAPNVTLDTSMAARSMCVVMDMDALPTVLRQYFDTAVQSPKGTTAYDLLGQFDLALERLGAPYYPRTYRPFNW